MFYFNFKHLCSDLGLKIYPIAQKLNLPRSFFNSLNDNSVKSINLDSLDLLLNYLRVDLSEFVEYFPLILSILKQEKINDYYSLQIVFEGQSKKYNLNDRILYSGDYAKVNSENTLYANISFVIKKEQDTYILYLENSSDNKRRWESWLKKAIFQLVNDKESKVVPFFNALQSNLQSIILNSIDEVKKIKIDCESLLFIKYPFDDTATLRLLKKEREELDLKIKELESRLNQ